jgi:serine/threonine protein kinase
VSTETLFAGRYRLLRPLGHGGMAVVELAEDVELQRIVAVKLLADNLARDDGFRQRFLREARLAAGLAHPNIVRVFDTGDADGRPYIVMEYVDGETVHALLERERRIETARAVEIALQVCAGLAAAHATGLVHRDIKPQNLLVGKDGVVKITDFGIARLDDGGTRLTMTGTVLGTAAYLAPEQAAGDDVTVAADVYAVGAVLYELLTGRPPRTVSSLAELGARAEETIMPVRDLAPDVPAELELVIMRCLARLPEHRPASAAELAHELAAAVPDAKTRVLPAASPPARFRARLRRWPFVVAALLVVGAVLLAVALTSGGGAPAAKPKPAAPLHVQPVPAATNGAQQARNLARWLRQNSR